MAKLVSKVYGDALFSLATEENQVDELWEEAAMVHEAVDTNPDFLSVLCHPEPVSYTHLTPADETIPV